MIDMGTIPELDLAKIGMLEAAAGQLTSLGGQVQTTGIDVHTTFQQVTASYDAPEAQTLANSTQPVKSQSDLFANDVTAAGTALATFAQQIQPIAVRLQILKAELAADPENPQVTYEIEQTCAQFHACEQQAANAIEAAYGSTRRWQQPTDLAKPSPWSDVAQGAVMVGMGVGGELLGLALDGTGVGAAIGVPLDIASGLLIRRGLSLAAKGLIVQMTAGEDTGSEDKKDENNNGDGESQGNQDPPKRGSIDESERSFSEPEKEIADVLESEGKNVKAIKESGIEGVRTADAEVDGVPTEFKTLDPGASNTSVKGALNSAKGQARDVVIDGRGSGITESEAQRGVARSVGANPGRFDNIRVLGDGFEVNWPGDAK